MSCSTIYWVIIWLSCLSLKTLTSTSLIRNIIPVTTITCCRSRNTACIINASRASLRSSYTFVLSSCTLHAHGARRSIARVAGVTAGPPRGAEVSAVAHARRAAGAVFGRIGVCRTGRTGISCWAIVSAVAHARRGAGAACGSICISPHTFSASLWSWFTFVMSNPTFFADNDIVIVIGKIARIAVSYAGPSRGAEKSHITSASSLSRGVGI
jgi:hypothetical protein